MSTGAARTPEEIHRIYDDVEFGEWMHAQIMEVSATEDDPLAVRRVKQVQDRLNCVRGAQPFLQSVILYASEPAAFIGPGRYLYVTRGLLHRAWWEDGMAMVVAHEMAHHDLGHTRLFTEKLHWLRQVPGSMLIHVFRHAAQRWLNSPEQEAAADELGLNLCLSVRYDGRRCVDVFDILETYALDHGALETALGSDDAPLLPGEVGRLLQAGQTWLRQRTHGYYSIRERKAALRRQLERLRR